MLKLLPDQEAAASLKNRTTFFYFFNLKEVTNDGATIRQLFAQHGAKCVLWLNCEYAFVGEGEDCWTHAALFQFPDTQAVKQAIDQGISSDEIAAVQGFAVGPSKPPQLILFLFKLLRPLGFLFARGTTKKWTVNQVVEILGGEGGIYATKKQISRHLENNRPSKAYMINLLQTYKKARYPDGNITVSGATAYYKRYGFVATRSVVMLGGTLVFGGKMGQPFTEVNAPSLTKGGWEGLGIMRYPSPSKLIALEKMPGYKKSLVHRDAGLERTVLVISKNGLDQ